MYPGVEGWEGGGQAFEEHLKFFPESQQHVKTSAHPFFSIPCFCAAFLFCFVFQTDGGLWELLTVFTFPQLLLGLRISAHAYEPSVFPSGMPQSMFFACLCFFLAELYFSLVCSLFPAGLCELVSHPTFLFQGSNFNGTREGTSLTSPDPYAFRLFLMKLELMF